MDTFDRLAHSRLNLAHRMALAGRRVERRAAGGAILEGTDRPVRKVVIGWMTPRLYLWAVPFVAAAVVLYAVFDRLRLGPVGFLLGFLALLILPVTVLTTDATLTYLRLRRRPLPRNFLTALPPRLFMKVTIAAAAITLAGAVAVLVAVAVSGG